METRFLWFERVARRPVLVLSRFGAVEPGALVNWYRRAEFKRQLFASGCRPTEFDLDYLIVDAQRDLADLAGCTTPVFADGRYRLLEFLASPP